MQNVYIYIYVCIYRYEYIYLQDTGNCLDHMYNYVCHWTEQCKN